MMILAGDVGGTHARLALIESLQSPDATHDARSRHVIERRDYDSRAFAGLEPIVQDFVARTGATPDAACLGVACPIVGGICETSNLPWLIEVDRFGDRVGLPGLRFINDFDAIGWAIAELEPGDVVTLREGAPRAHAPIGLIGAGTGLGCGYLTWDGLRYRVHASEGGHVDFAPRTPLQVELYSWLAVRFPRVSYERIVSGPGLINVYRFLVDRGAPESPAVRRAMAVAGGGAGADAGAGVRGGAGADPARAISASGLAGDDEVCVQALDIFCAVFGAQAGNLGVLLKATGGIYLAGGIAPAILPALRSGGFERAFLDKGRASEVVDAIPVRVIVRDGAGLLGAAVAAESPG